MNLEQYVKSLVDGLTTVKIAQTGTHSTYIKLSRFDSWMTIRISDHCPNKKNRTGWYFDIDSKASNIHKRVAYAVKHFIAQSNISYLHQLLECSNN